MRPAEESTPDVGEAGAPTMLREERATAVARGLLWAFVAAIALQLGGGLYEHAAMVPRWSTASAVNVSYAIANSGQLHAAIAFWPYVSPIVVALAFANAFVAWRSQGLARGWWFGAALCELLVSAVTYAYFVPELRALMTDIVRGEDIESRALAWASLNGARLVLEAFAFTLALAAFARYGSRRVRDPEPPSM